MAGRFPEGRRSDRLLRLYAIISLVVLFLLPGDMTSRLFAVAGTGVIMVAAILFGVIRSKREEREPAERDRFDSRTARAQIPSGRRGRVLMLLASTLIVGGTALALLITGLLNGEAAWFLQAASIPVLGLYSWAWIRVPRVGIVVRRNDVVATSWFSSTVYRREVVERWSAERYTGVLYVLGWPAAGVLWSPGIYLWISEIRVARKSRAR